MRNTIFFTVACNAKFEIRIRQLGSATDLTFVKGLVFRTVLRLKAPSPRRNFLAMACLVNDFRSEKNQVAGKRRDQRHAIRHWSNEKFGEEYHRHYPGNPLDLRGQNEQNVNRFIRIKSGEGQKQRRDQHQVGKIAAEDKGGHSRADHPDKKIKREAKSAPGTLESFTDPPEKPKSKKDPPWTQRLGNKNV